MSGDAYIFTTPDTDVVRVEFYIDDPTKLGAPFRTEGVAPYDFAGSEDNGDASPYDTNQLTDGFHTITAEITHASGLITIHAEVAIENGGSTLGFKPPTDVDFTVLGVGSDSTAVELDATDGSAASFTTTVSAGDDWLTATENSSTTPATLTVTANSTGLAEGLYEGTVTASAAGLNDAVLNVSLDVLAADSTYQLTISAGADRSGATELLDDDVLSGDVYIYTSPDTAVTGVRFYLDNPAATGTPFHTEGAAPYDLIGTEQNGNAKPWDTTTQIDGVHTITAALDVFGGSTEIVTRSIRIANAAPALSFGQTEASVVMDPNSVENLAFLLTTTDGLPVDFELESSVTWMTATCSGCSPVDEGTTDATVAVSIDSSTLSTGAHSATLTAMDLGGIVTNAVVDISVFVAGDGAFELFASDSSDRSAPYALDGATLSGSVYLHLLPETSITGVEFYLDNVSLSGTPDKVEGRAPWDFAGGSADSANPTDTTTLTDGFHTLSAVLSLVGGGEQVIEATFLVSNGPPSLVFDPVSLGLALEANTQNTTTVSLLTNTDEVTTVTLSASESWVVATSVGDTPTDVDIDLDSTGLASGTYSASVTASAPGYDDGILDITLVVFIPGDHTILQSTNSDRSNASDLNKSNAFGDIFAFVSPTNDVDTVAFYIDDPSTVGTAHRLEQSAPFDLNGGGADANPYDTTVLGDGLHSITAVVTLNNGGTETVIASFNVSNGTPGLLFSPDDLFILANPNGEGSGQSIVGTSDGSVTQYSLTEDTDWLTFEQSSQDTGPAVLFEVDTTGLDPGTHTATVTATADGYLPADLTVLTQVAGSNVYDIVYSVEQDLSGTASLANAFVTGDIYVVTTPDTDVDTVTFYLDDPATEGEPLRIEQNAPYAMYGGPPTATIAFDTTDLGDGVHTVTAVVKTLEGNQEIINAPFTIQNGFATLEFESPSVLMAVDENSTSTLDVELTTSDLVAADFTLTESADWLVISPETGTTPSTIELQVSSVDLTPGTYTTTVEATADGFGSASMEVSMSVQGKSIYDILVSDTSTRDSPVLLKDEDEISGVKYFFTSPDSDVDSVKFHIDDPTASGSPHRTENNAPFDLAGGSVLAANPYFTTNLVDGLHTITAVIKTNDGGTDIITVDFLVSNQAPGLTASPGSLTFLNVEGEPAPAAQSLGINTNDSALADFTIALEDAWLDVDITTGQTPATASVSVNIAGLGVGVYNSTITVTAPGFTTLEVPVTLNIQQNICDPLECSEILVTPPYELTFEEDHGAVTAGIGVDEKGSGFTMILPTENGFGYLPGSLSIDHGTGLLEISSTSGSMSGLTNSQDNCLGVGIDVPSQISLIRTTMTDIPTLTGEFEQAGLWFGTDDRNHLRLFVNSAPEGDRVRFLMEVNDVQSNLKFSTAFMDLSGAEVTFVLRVDPVNQEISGQYAIDGGSLLPLGTFSPPPEFFSFDAAGIDPEIGTRSFSGIFASHRNAAASQTYRFSEFSLTSEPLPPPQTEIAFERVSFPQTVLNPTSMVYGPDGKLYVLEITGTIHAFELGPSRLPIGHQVITTFTDVYGPRLALGITIDPLSTSTDVDLWVCHSSPDQDAGDINSGTVSRLSGADLDVVEDVIVGLPRAFANHAPNSLHFGPDDLLYIAIGGNTGSGAPNTSGSEFGLRTEQYLSAAIIRCDVLALSWPIDCDDGLTTDDTLNEPGIPACADGLDPEVVVFSSGLRNLYDFAFHPNGFIYGPDNGLGVTGTYPPDAFAPCFGPGTVPDDDPGPQQDILLRIVQGQYYGHPNPARDECVFKDGTEQGVSALPNYEPPILNLGDHKSTNGTIVYSSSTAFCGALEGDILMTNFSVGDDLVRVELSSDGLSAPKPAFSLVGGFDDPLPITEDDTGTVFIGEFNGDRVTALVPIDTGCWSTGEDLPVSLLDVSGAAIGGLFYVVTGKNNTGPINSLFIYNPITDSWTTAASRPGAGVENPAVVAVDGLLYVFGGSTLPFSGALTDANVYDPVTNTWSPLASMPTARGGATAKEVDGLIYVIGGMDVDGASIATVETYDPITDTWDSVSGLTTRRDNAGSAVLDGHIYVFGGRIRNSNGSVVDGTLSSVESYDPLLDTWVNQADMPTGRRTMAVVTLNGRALVIGGEATVDGGAFAQNEEYNPSFNTWRTLAPMLSPRHGCAGATIDGEVFIAGGGIVAGGSYSSILEIFSFTTEQ